MGIFCMGLAFYLFVPVIIAWVVIFAFGEFNAIDDATSKARIMGGPLPTHRLTEDLPPCS
jgi:hypothetical protein